jgi:hypothetical protein
MAVEVRVQAQRRDRWVSWIVVVVFAASLILGWFVRMAAEGRAVTYEVEGLRMQYPADWVRANVHSPVLVQVEDRWAVPYRTTLTLERRPVPPDVERVLPTIQSTIDLARGRSWTAYRVLAKEMDIPVRGTTGMRVRFAYVETNPNLFLDTVPVVMYGEDYIFPGKDEVYVATLTAAEDNFARAQKVLSLLLRSLQIQE